MRGKQCDALSRNKGGLAQLGEHLLCKQGVVGSIPSSSTIGNWKKVLGSGLYLVSITKRLGIGFFVIDRDCSIDRSGR